MEAETLCKTTGVPNEAVCGRTLMNIAAMAKTNNDWCKDFLITLRNFMSREDSPKQAGMYVSHIVIRDSIL